MGFLGKNSLSGYQAQKKGEKIMGEDQPCHASPLRTAAGYWRAKCSPLFTSQNQRCFQPLLLAKVKSQSPFLSEAEYFQPL